MASRNDSLKLPTEILHRIAALLASELDAEPYQSKRTEAGHALRNLSLASSYYRDVSQPELFRTLTIGTNCKGAAQNEATTLAKAAARIDFFQAHPHLLNHVRHFNLFFQSHSRIADAAASGYRDMCNRSLTFFLPLVNGLESFMTEWKTQLNDPCRSPWELAWDEETRRVVSSCIANSPRLLMVEIRAWVGPISFLKDLPNSLFALKVVRAPLLDFASTDVALPPNEVRFRPKVVELDLDLAFARLLPFIAAQGEVFLSQVHTLVLQGHSLSMLNTVLAMAAPTLRCLRLSNLWCILGWFHMNPGDTFVNVPGLEELAVTIDILGNSFPSSSRSDAMVGMFKEHFHPAFSTIQKLVLGVAWTPNQEWTMDDQDRISESNLYQGKAGGLKMLDEYLAGNPSVLGDLRQVVIEVTVKKSSKSRTGPYRPVAGWVLSKAKEDMEAIMANTLSKFNGSVTILQGSW